MNDERRERYAAAISAKTAWHGGTDLQEQADAAMAMADAEQEDVWLSLEAANGYAAKLATENARLRAEIGDYDTNAELRAQLAEQLRQKDALRATIERVRDVLDSSEWHSHFKDKVRRALNGETR